MTTGSGWEEGREPIPPGVVSAIRGRYQAPGLSWVTRVLVALGLVTLVVPDDVRIAIATTAVGGVIATPLLRIAWLVFRWGQERDRRFVVTGLVLLGVVVAGVVLAALGVGD